MGVGGIRSSNCWNNNCWSIIIQYFGVQRFINCLSTWWFNGNNNINIDGSIAIKQNMNEFSEFVVDSCVVKIIIK